MTIAVQHRKAIPLGVKLKAALAAAGFSEAEIEAPGGIEFDHCPALALRVVDEETGDLVPAANDWRFIRPLRKADHRAKTCGRRGERRVTSAGSDQHAVAKVRRISADVEESRRRMLAKEAGEPREKRSRIPSRPFPKKGSRR